MWVPPQEACTTQCWGPPRPGTAWARSLDPPCRSFKPRRPYSPRPHVNTSASQAVLSMVAANDGHAADEGMGALYGLGVRRLV